MRARLTKALHEAAQAQDTRAVHLLRLIQAALKERDHCARAAGRADGLSDEEVTAMLQAMVDQRRESMRRYEESGQLDLAQQEEEEIGIIEQFLPPKLDETQLETAVTDAIAETGARDIKDCGRVMTALKNRYPGRMNVAKARRMVVQQLD
jgi:uncharacterized protein